MEKKELEFLKEITDIQGTSGNEDAVRTYLKEKFLPVADKVELDGMGSLMATLGTEGPRVLAAGHICLFLSFPLYRSYHQLINSLFHHLRSQLTYIVNVLQVFAFLFHLLIFDYNQAIVTINTYTNHS